MRHLNALKNKLSGYKSGTDSQPIEITLDGCTKNQEYKHDKSYAQIVNFDGFKASAINPDVFSSDVALVVFQGSGKELSEAIITISGWSGADGAVLDVVSERSGDKGSLPFGYKK